VHAVVVFDMETVAVGTAEAVKELKICEETCIYDAEGNCVAKVYRLC